MPINTLPENVYCPESEHHVNVHDPAIVERIFQARRMFDDFFNRFSIDFDLNRPEGIENLYAIAESEGVFKAAQEIRELIFGRDMHFYGVSYLWDNCVEYCVYCPLSVPSRLKAQEKGEKVKDKKLTVDEAVQDTLAVMKDGHTHICYLTGSVPGKERFADEIIPYLNKIMDECYRLGLKEIILNVEPLDECGFKKIADAVHDFNQKKSASISLQFRVFQETYNREAYKELHPKGSKADFDYRYSSQARALRAGFDNVGLGALFGLYRYPLKEIASLRQHAEEIQLEFGKLPARVCLPSANELAKISVVVPLKLRRGNYDNDDSMGTLVIKGTYEKANELIYALARLAMPQINLVSSERDTPAMLEILDRYATCTTVNVHPGVGDNILTESAGGEKSGFIHKAQATVFPRSSSGLAEEMRKRGYNPILK